MDWIPAISTTSLLAFALFLFRNLIKTRLTNSVSHAYNEKIEKLRTELRQKEETLKADLRAKENQIEALRSGALSSVANRQAIIFERQIKAIETLWDSILSLGPAKAVSAWMAFIKFETAAKSAAQNPKTREMFSMLGNVDLNNIQTSQAEKTRPFISPIAWAYYSAYQAIVLHAVMRLQILKNGIDDVDVIDTEKVTNLVKVALPHQVEFIEKYDPSAFHFLLEELEGKILFAFERMLKGEDADKDILQKASAIIKESEILMESNRSANAV
ncbi:MAG: hypothetical protein WA081_16280 [Desulfosalsimonadaceae bacterium]